MGVGEEEDGGWGDGEMGGRRELGVRSWGLGEEGSWELGVGGWGKKGVGS
uniref:Uncharacterized protein n=1 Tax=Desertifilum tharense IPPAS B-1220 TaxID=1781255 RepID=A0ACD5GTX7_9CYAN